MKKIKKKAFFLKFFRDEDEEMRKFIETEMDKRTRGRGKDEESDEVFFNFELNLL